MSYISYAVVAGMFSISQSLSVNTEMAEFTRIFIAMAVVFLGASFFIKEPIKQMLKKERVKIQ